MKNFKSFVQINELLGVKPKAKKEHDFVHSTYLAQVKDPADLKKTGPEEIGPKDTKTGQGKRPADRLDNKQEFGEAYATIKSKMKNEEHQDALMALYDELNETNQKLFLVQLEENSEKLLEFAMNKHEE